MSSQLEYTISSFQLNTTHQFLMKRSTQSLLRRSSRRLYQQICSLTQRLLLIHLENLMSVVQLLMQVLQEERLSSIHTEDGAHMEVVLSQERTHPRLIDPLPIMEDTLQSLLLPMDSLIDASFKFHMQSVSPTHFPSISTPTEQSKRDSLMMTLLEL